jgi:signal recognition particle subunit SRP54
MFDFLTQKFSTLFSSLSGKKQLDAATVQSTIEQVKEALLAADVPYDLVQTFATTIKDEIAQQKPMPSLKASEQLLKVVYDKMVTFLGGENKELFIPRIPATFMMIGLQGSGKTTTLGKLAFYLRTLAQEKKINYRILVASVDYYRPAAIDQLAIVAQKAHVDFYRAASNEPIAAAAEIQEHARKNQYNILLLDTAGRLHIDNTMLAELRTIDSMLQPHHKILVLDAMTGQESLTVARAFEQGVGFDGSILSKADSDARGGAAFSFRYALKKPILFIGTGEKVEDLALFHPERAASRMLGMGDMQSLIERANQKIKEQEQRDVYNSWEKGELTLNDFAQQMDMVNRLGSLSSVMKYMPGLGSMNISSDMVEKGQQEMRRFRAIINSMTPKERIYTRLLNDSRKRRIAKGAGVTIAEIDKLLTRFVNMQQYAKLIKKSGGLRNVFK